MTSAVFPSGHADYIHDVCYDWFGDRLATCSSDQRIRIFQRTTPTNQQQQTPPSASFPFHNIAELRGHTGSIHRLSFAHPEYGTLLASCSSDRTVILHEQVKEHSGADGSSGWVWKQRVRLNDSRVSVVDCKFAPPHLGLQLATLSLDGRLRIYESRDLMNLAVWGLVHDIATIDATTLSTSASTATEPPSPHLAAALSFNPSPFDPPMIAVAATSAVRILECDTHTRKYRTLFASLSPPHEGDVHDISWAPNPGRSYHLIASAGRDGSVRIYTLRWDDKGGDSGGGGWVAGCAGVLSGHRAAVRRVCWNTSGSLLASTGDDGVTRVWKADYNLNWRQIAQTSTTNVPATSAAGVFATQRQ